jgi:hypothetical protein
MRKISVAVLGFSIVAGGAMAQAAGEKTLAATIGVYVFPTAGQTPEKQSMEEVECYNFAVTNTGSDPFELQKQASATQQQTEQQVQQAKGSTQGARGKGAIGGAAAGALIGEIANDDAGEGAAWGAALGAMGARRSAEKRAHEAQASAQQSGAQKQAATAEQIENFKKAMSVCLEAKKYMVKY